MLAQINIHANMRHTDLEQMHAQFARETDGRLYMKKVHEIFKYSLLYLPVLLN